MPILLTVICAVFGGMIAVSLFFDLMVLRDGAKTPLDVLQFIQSYYRMLGRSPFVSVARVVMTAMLLFASWQSFRQTDCRPIRQLSLM